MNGSHFTEAEVAALHPDVQHFLNIGEDGRIGTGKGSPEVQALGREIALTAMAGRAGGLTDSQIGEKLAGVVRGHGIDVPEVYTGLTEGEKKRIVGMAWVVGVSCLAGTAGTAVFLALVR